MSGHSKWSTIKRKKGAEDAKRSKMFSKIVKEITVAVKEGGNDPEANPRLRLAIANAKGVNMPKNNVERAISKADKDTSNFEEIVYEGYAPGGVAIYVECTTDNQNRTISNVRSYFNKFNGNLAKNGSLSFLFDRKGVFQVPQGELDEEEFMMEAIDAGAEDIELMDGIFHITTSMEDFGPMMKKLEAMGLEPESAKLERIPKTTAEVDVNTAKTAIKLIETFEEDDDVQNVYHNMEMTEEIMTAMES